MKYLFIILSIIIFSCNTAEKQNQSSSAEKPARDTAVQTKLDGCYLMVIGKDSAFLEIQPGATSIRGSLVYKRFEKDSNHGNFEGIRQNNIIKGWYKFNSEGVISVRELYLKISGESLAEGYGDLDMKGDTAIFAYPTTVIYEDKHPFIKVPCTDKF